MYTRYDPDTRSNASYLSVKNAKRRAAGRFFSGKSTKVDALIRLNEAFHTLCMMLKCVAASAAETELGALFLSAKVGKVIRLIL